MSDFSRSKVAFSSEARAKLLRGMTTVAEAVGCTLGPKGKTVLIQKQSGTPTVTKDGVTVARSINLKDPIERMGAELIKEAASQTNDLAGDGTTTTTILTHAMVVEATRCLDAGFSSTRLIEGVKHAAAAVEDGIRQSALKVEDHAVLKDVATISANNDKTTGTLIASAFEKVGRDGIITVEDAKGMSTTLETIEGMQFERGYTSPYFITHSEKMIALYDDALVLVTDRKVATLAQIVPVLELVHRSGRPLLIVADDIETEALQGLVLNKTKSNLKVVAVRAPELIVSAPPPVMVLPAAPMLIAVAAPKALTVVAFVFNSANVPEPVVSDVVMFGDVPNTATPVPVSSVSDAERFAEVPLVAS
jgi:chaperonin GroEL